MMQESNLRAGYFSRRFYSADLAFASAPPIGVSLRFSIHPKAPGDVSSHPDGSNPAIRARHWVLSMAY